MLIKESRLRRIIRQTLALELREDVSMPARAGTNSPARLLGIEDSYDGVSGKIVSINDAMNNVNDLILSGDEQAKTAYRALQRVLTASQDQEWDYEEQLGLVRKAASEWIRWMTKGSVTPTEENRKIYDFLKAAAGRLKEGQPIFDYMSEIQEQKEIPKPDQGWLEYFTKSPPGSKGQNVQIWNSWLARQASYNLNGPEDFAFQSYVMWWKDHKSRGTWRDGGNAIAVITQLNSETRPEILDDKDIPGKITRDNFSEITGLDSTGLI